MQFTKVKGDLFRMLNRKLAKKVEILPDEEYYGLKVPMELEYYLLESEINDLEELKGKTAYGIEIVKRVSTSNTENRIVKNLSCSKESTENILNKLATNTVTPVGLPFILDDMLGI